MKRDRGHRRRRCARSRRLRRPHAALEDPDLNLSGLKMRTNSTFVWRGKSGWPQICCPILCHRCPSTANSAFPPRQNADCPSKLPRLPPARRRGSSPSSKRKRALPCRCHIHAESAPGNDRIHAAHARARIRFDLKHSPLRAPHASAIHAATQRVPFPLISAIEPSALCKRIRPDRGPVHRKNSMPSAPTPVLRAHSRRVSSAQSRPAAASSVTIRKSLPQACALVKGINRPPDLARCYHRAAALCAAEESEM